MVQEKSMLTISPQLSVVVGTLNRLEQLRNCIGSIEKETNCAHLVYIIDAGSTDGTIEYLESIRSETIIPVFQGLKLGQSVSYNQVFRQVVTPFVCWLSDDNEIINNSLDSAVSILKKSSQIGMVALKVKDVEGPFVKAPYIGGISSLGILNVNQGMLPIRVLNQVGGFSEEFRDYGIDPDLTAKVLLADYQVVYTKKIAILHYRNWSVDKNSQAYKIMIEKNREASELYHQKFFDHIISIPVPASRLKVKEAAKKVILTESFCTKHRNIKWIRDINNIINSKFIRFFDLWLTLFKPFYLVQSIPMQKKQAL